MGAKHIVPSIARVRSAVGFCRSDDSCGLDRQLLIIESYAVLHGLNLRSIVTQRLGSRISTSAIRAVAAKKLPFEEQSLLLIVDLSRLTRRGFDDHHRICGILKDAGFEVRATGTAPLLTAGMLPRVPDARSINLSAIRSRHAPSIAALDRPLRDLAICH